MSEITTEQAMNQLTKALREDPGYRLKWKINIVKAFMDDWQLAHERLGYNAIQTNEQVYVIANKAADRLLEQFESDHKTPDRF